MESLNDALLSLLKMPEIQAQIMKLGDSNTYAIGNKKVDITFKDTVSVISEASFLFANRDDLMRKARPLVLLTNPSAGLLSDLVRDYFLWESDSEDIRQEVLRIYSLSIKK